MTQINITVTPYDDLIDVSRTIRIIHLEPNQVITVHAKTLRSNGIVWQSHAEFVADGNSIVDLSQQAPLSGTYSGIDAMGLIWSQVPEIQGERDLFPDNMLMPLETVIMVIVDGQEYSSSLIQRVAAEGVKRIDVNEEGLVGAVYLPATEGPHPAIMILNGSGGGINEHRAALYASQGYIAFALAYFKAPGLSDYISNTPLEYFKQGLDWLRGNYHPLNDFVAINGQSRGGELVLLLASIYPKDISAVVAYVPGAVVHSGQNAADPKVGRDGPAWLLNGQPIPHIWENNQTATWAPFDEGEPPYRHDKAVLTALQDPDAVERARIRVEQIEAPIILLSATDDGAWPSSVYSKMVVDHLKQNDFQYKVAWVDTENGGHSIVFPYVPTTQNVHVHPVSGRISTNGGEAKANALSDQRSWQAIQEFLRSAVAAHS